MAGDEVTDGTDEQAAPVKDQLLQDVFEDRPGHAELMKLLGGRRVDVVRTGEADEYDEKPPAKTQ